MNAAQQRLIVARTFPVATAESALAANAAAGVGPPAGAAAVGPSAIAGARVCLFERLYYSYSAARFLQ